jgi:hypothetical protein
MMKMNYQAAPYVPVVTPSGYSSQELVVPLYGAEKPGPCPWLVGGIAGAVGIGIGILVGRSMR